MQSQFSKVESFFAALISFVAPASALVDSWMQPIQRKLLYNNNGICFGRKNFAISLCCIVRFTMCIVCSFVDVHCEWLLFERHAVCFFKEKSTTNIHGSVLQVAAILHESHHHRCRLRHHHHHQFNGCSEKKMPTLHFNLNTCRQCALNHLNPIFSSCESFNAYICYHVWIYKREREKVE